MPDDQQQQRADILEAGDSRHELPEASHLYLIDCLFMIGCGRPDALEPQHRKKQTYLYRNLKPVTFEEIRAWLDLTGSNLTPWEAETLRVLSEAYVVQLAKSHSPDSQPPYDARSVDEMRERTQNQFERLFKQYGGKRG